MLPSVYIFEDEGKKPLYIGKAIHPKTRLRQHLKAAEDRRTKQADFVGQTRFISFYEMSSELEAILLEARLIQMYQPQFNSIQKDDKSNIYITISNDDFPRVALSRKRDIPRGVVYFGPFKSATQTNEILKISRRIFRFCKNPPKDRVRGGRACFYYHIDLCDGACVGTLSKADYRKKIGYLKKFLGGRSVSVREGLVREIRKNSKEQRYELAAEKKRMLEALKTSLEVNTSLTGFLKTRPQTDRGIEELRAILIKFGVESSLERIEGYDVATLMQKDTVGSMVVFWLGEADKKEYRLFKMDDWSGGDVGAMAEMINRRFKNQSWERPNLVLLDGGKPQLSTAGKLVPDEIPVISLAKKEEIIIIPVKGGYEEVRLPMTSPALKLLQQIRDESHRFATTFHKKVRAKKLTH